MEYIVNLKNFLLKSNIDFGAYALVTYNGRTEPTWFSKYGYDWFLESPCELRIVTEDPTDRFIEEYVSELLEDEVDTDSYINEFIKPMIINNILYEIENYQCSPYLPEYVDEVRLINERECLIYILDTIKK